MFRKYLFLVVLVLVASRPAFAVEMQDGDARGAQQPPRVPPPGEPARPAPPAPGQPGSPTPPSPQGQDNRRMRGPARDLNVHIELTISDQTGTAAPEKKVVSLLAADQTMGRVRANARANRANVGFVGTGLNVDARPIVLEGDRILLELTLEYMPLRENQVLAQEPTNLNESISVILVNGKPLMISQAADPISDRKMTVEVKATIVR